MKVSKKKRFILGIVILSIAIVWAVMAVKMWIIPQENAEEGDNSVETVVPTVSIETPGKVSVGREEPIDLEVSLSTLEEEIYPAASFSISFDPSKLELIEVKEGNVRITDSNSSSGYQLPVWSVNVEKCNKTGLINLMYLDMTGGKYAFVGDALLEEENILFRLSFRLRGSAMVGDVYELCIEDAVFANADENKSLATAQDNLKAINGRIVVGE